ncbi:MAG TPA: esterase-like activity of phytase family protein, partial [Woeseiaceae bacterium]|nr:esterase-like activity of phytase family protein [Woeseiaceae bacterium]
PIPFSALSGMDALPDGDLVAVWDSFYADSRIFTIDPHAKPAVITDSLEYTGGSGDFDAEGIAVAPDGESFWIASEGNRSGSRKNRLLHVDTAGAVMQEVFLPDEVEDCRDAENDADGHTGTLGSGFEGLALLPGDDGYRLLVAQQRGWDYTTEGCEDLDDDPDGSNPEEPAYTRIWIYDPDADGWDWVPWELAPKPENASWVGLSEIARGGDGTYVLIERDNRTGDFAALKTLVQVGAEDMADGISADEKDVLDILPALKATNGWISDKPEGVAIDSQGKVYVVTDNDGVDDWSGENWFIKLGKLDDLY